MFVFRVLCISAVQVAMDGAVNFGLGFWVKFRG
jgi:hypothetical protein